MSDNDDKEIANPFEEIQRQIRKLLKDNNINAGEIIMGPSSIPEIPPADKKSSSKEDEEALEKIRRFNLKPREIVDYLNRFVIKQEEAKKVLSVSVCDHYNHVRQCIANPDLLEKEYNKQNILILGPTGVGKTYLMRNIARLIGVPFVKADATKFSETGYVGSDVEDLVRDLLKAANGNIDLAQYGIIYIDEIDKIATTGDGHGRDVSGRGVQINLLKLMEDSDVNIASPSDMLAQMQAVMDMTRSANKKRKKHINTRHILFIVSGAFDKLAENIKRRIDTTSIGFSTNPTLSSEDLNQYLHKAVTKDFIQYGFEPEFVGRLPVRVACDPLNKDDLARILVSSEGSILNQYKNDFKGYGIHFDIDGEAIQEIAYQAAEEQTGARGLLTILEKTFRDFKYRLPSTAIENFSVTVKTIQKPKDALNELLEKNKHLQSDVLRKDIERFVDSFQAEHDFLLEFSEDAAESLIQESLDSDKTIRSICEHLFKDFHHGLKIIARNTGKKSFKIEKSTLKNPDRELSDWVIRSFEDKDSKKQDKKASVNDDEA